MIHPFLIGLFPILSVYSHNVYELPLQVLVGPLGVVLVLTGAIWLVLRVSTRDSLRAGLTTSLLVALFFGFENLHKGLDVAWIYLNEFWVDRNTHVLPMVVLAIEGIVAVGGGLAIYRWIGKPWRWTSYLNAFTLILVALPILGLITAKVGDSHSRPAHDQQALPSLGQKGSTPDIYFILVDGYARADVMKEIYDFDNRPFLDRLERRGFVVARRSTSNYCQTMLSVASTLNADYLDNVVDTSSHDLLQLETAIHQNQVSRLLRPRGYRTVAFSTGFSATDLTKADVYLAPGPGSSAFQEILIEMTPLATILVEAKWDDRFSRNRKRTLFLLDRLPSVARMPGPKFTFAHILSPHPPFVFGKNGEDVSPRIFGPNNKIQPLDPFIGTPEYVRQAYRDQAAFLTARIDQTIDRILELSPEPPVIILQSDHGAWLHYHPNDVESTDLRERFGTLNAILIPGRKRIDGFSDDAVSVNTFRIVMNNLFGAKLPLLEPRNYFSPVVEPLVLTNVTERLHSERERTRKFQPPPEFLGLMQQF